MVNLYEILVPTQYNNGKPVRTRHHKEWDKVVVKIAGGMSLFKPFLGTWKMADKVYRERMIPVRIACTEKEINKIADFTASHYKQLAVMFYRISDLVIIKEYAQWRKVK